MAVAEEQAPRFAFGKNWRRFLRVLDEERIAEAERSLERMLGTGALEGRAFLDVGSGSGLFSLAAIRQGAARVHSFDFDPASVACTAELRARYLPANELWTVEGGDVLDPDYAAALGKWDVVYSWGVLHHTGRMWDALRTVDKLVAPGGVLFIAIYNDQGWRSRVWRGIKRLYNALPGPLRPILLLAVALPRELLQLARHLLRLRPQGYLRMWTDYKSARGMSRWRDIVDWIGGYPFEVATPEQVVGFYRDRGYELEASTLDRAGSGCNEFVFRRVG